VVVGRAERKGLAETTTDFVVQPAKQRNERRKAELKSTMPFFLILGLTH
jgi:hypothetical protein